MPAHERNLMQAKSGDEDFAVVRKIWLLEHSGDHKLIESLRTYAATGAVLAQS